MDNKLNKWTIKGQVQEIHATDNSDKWVGPTDADRSQITSVTLFIHKKQREEAHRMCNLGVPCIIERCVRTRVL